MPDDKTPLLDAPPAKVKPWTTGEIYDGLEKLCPSGAYALLREFPDGTGMNKGRSADALAMSLWPSRGLSLIGFEVKASRSDWVKERDNPAKAEAFARYCDQWFLVVGAREIVHPGELPPTWGLIAPKGGPLKVIVEATPNADPTPVGRKFLAGLFRRLVEQVERVDEVKVAREQGRLQGRSEADAQHKAAEEHRRNHASDRLSRLERTVREFEEASGLKLEPDHWRSGRDLGEAVGILMALGYPDLTVKVEHLAKQGREIVALADRLRALVEGEATP